MSGSIPKIESITHYEYIEMSSLSSNEWKLIDHSSPGNATYGE